MRLTRLFALPLSLLILPAEAARRKAASDPDYDGDWVFFPPDTEGEGGG